MSDRIEDAIVLAKSRWAQLHRCDLHDDTWNALVQRYVVGDILEAIKLTRDTRDPRPERIYARFERFLIQLEAKRAGNTY